LGNGAYGVIITVGASNNLVGGTTAGAGNVIAFNGVTAAVVYGETSQGNSILGNSMHDNGHLGIDLQDDGVTPNDRLDTDIGANNFQNFPVVGSAKHKGTGTSVLGSLLSRPNARFRIELFSSPACDPSGYGEAQSYVGFVNVRTSASGRATFSVSFATSLPVGSFVTGTATDSAGNTSELSACRAVK
jgi:hypothetical protein